MILGAARVWSVEANPACGGVPWWVPFSRALLFGSFPVHYHTQHLQPTADQVWAWMAVGFAGPEPPKHRHQQVGLEQRQRALGFLGLAWSGGSTGSHRLGSNRTGHGDGPAGLLLGRRYGVYGFKRWRFFLTLPEWPVLPDYRARRRANAAEPFPNGTTATRAKPRSYPGPTLGSAPGRF